MLTKKRLTKTNLNLKIFLTSLFLLLLAPVSVSVGYTGVEDPATTCSCECVSSTPMGLTCPNGCGGYCSGSGYNSSDVSDYNITPLSKDMYRSIWQYQMTYDGLVWGKVTTLGYKKINTPTKRPDHPEYALLFSMDVWTCEPGTVWSVNNIMSCAHTIEDFKTMKIFLAPGKGMHSIFLHKSYGDDGGGLYFVRMNEPPQGTYNYSTTHDNLMSNPGNNPQLNSIDDITGKDYIRLLGKSLSPVDILNITVPDNFPGGWVYIRLISGGGNVQFTSMEYSGTVVYDYYKTWYDNMNTTNGWLANGDPGEQTLTPTPSPTTPTPTISPTTQTPFPSGPDCAAKTCVGNSCYSKDETGNPYIKGTKTTDCATVEIKTSKTSLTAPDSSYLTWNTTNASKLGATCSGIYSGDASWYLSNEECKKDGQCTDKGYEMKFSSDKFGIETCILYPTNKSDGLPGTPSSFEVEVKEGSNSTSPTPTPTATNLCGNGKKDAGEYCDSTSNEDNCSISGGTCNSACKCIQNSTTSPTPSVQQQQACERDNPDCEKVTCNNVYCDDGCGRIKGTRVCDGR